MYEDPKSINGLLKLFVKEFRLEKGLLENRVLNMWDEVLGLTIARSTTEKYFKNGVLHVKLSSSVIRSELFMMRSQIKDEINRRVGSEIVKEIILK